MSRIETTCKIKVYELDGTDAFGKDVEIALQSHWYYGDRVVLAVGEKEYTVIAGDLQKAVQRCTS